VNAARSASTAVTFSHGTVSRNHGSVRSRIEVTARSLQEARQKGTQEAYAQAVGAIYGTDRQLSGMRRLLAAQAATLRGIQSQVIASRHAGDSYTVTLEVVRPESQIEDDLRSGSLSNYRLVVRMPETIDGRAIGDDTVETTMIGGLSDAGFTVYQPASDGELGIANRLASHSDAAYDSAGLRYLSNTVIVGTAASRYSQNNDGIFSYRATASVRAVEVDTHRVLFAREYQATWFGRDRGQAAQKSFDALETSFGGLPADLKNGMAMHPVVVDVPTADDSARLLELLKERPGVGAVARTTMGALTTYKFTTSDNPSFVALALGQDPSYKVVSVGASYSKE
jgi:hypothetical protein